MALKIRLQPRGTKNCRTFRLVVAESSHKRDGRFVESIGHYDPRRKLGSCDLERYSHWYGLGARPSETGEQLVRRFKAKDSQ